MSIVGQAITSKMLAYAIGVVILLTGLLALSVTANVRQWADHRAYVKGEAARLEAAAMKAGLAVASSIAKQKGKDDPKLLAAVQSIDARTKSLANQKRPPALPIQCAPGQQRMDAVNAGADK